MAQDIYVALSGHVSQDVRLQTVAQNIANMNTPGYRAEEVHFEAVLSEAGDRRTAFASRGDVYLSRQPGPVMPTGNPLDVAIEGQGWLAVEIDGGAIGYTRDGRLSLTEAGDLVTTTGFPVLDAGGAPIALDPRGGPVSIGGDGTIAQGGRVVGVLGVFLVPQTARLAPYGASVVLSDVAAEPAVDRVANRFKQGFVEGSNVEPVTELVRLVTIQRAFESTATAIDARHGAQSNAIRDLGPGG